ncbi:MAG: DUF2798 domain-containing protein [Candidatus Diapherotrites archaeon]|nr:DUF2798 domain-containing protein [Candidatus Diapherotrites archaeon]
MRKINSKYADLLFTVFLTLIMSLLMSIIITFVNVGLHQDFLMKWAIAFLAGLAVSFPATLIAVPVAKKIVKKVTSGQQRA